MKILIIGATGLIGNKLAITLVKNGHKIKILTRNKTKYENKLAYPCEIYEWQYNNEEIPEDALKDIDAVINLAGERVSTNKWSKNKKNLIYDSRVLTNQKIIETLNNLSDKITYITASAIGYYGNSKYEEFTENSIIAKDNFLSKVISDTEHEVLKNQNEDIRKIILRIGVVLDRNGGFLQKLLPIYTNNFGGKIGDGKQWMSFIHIDDLINIILFCLENKNIKGIFNAVSPNPITNKEFVQVLSKYTLSRNIFRIPKFLLKLFYGEMSSIILFSQKVSSKKIQEAGFSFEYETIEKAISNIFKDNIYKNHFLRNLNYKLFLKVDIDKIFNLFTDINNLSSLTPNKYKFELIRQTDEELKESTRFIFKFKFKFINLKWVIVISKYEKNKLFIDEQLKGPFKYFIHKHIFSSNKDNTIIEDDISFRIPFGKIGDFLFGNYIQKQIEEIFKYRIDKIIEIFLSNKE